MSSAPASSATTVPQPNLTQTQRRGLNAATKRTERNPCLMHLLLVRHAESTNNVLAEKVTLEHGVNPYGPNSTADVQYKYDQLRSHDPDLSPLGYRQAELLVQHPHLIDLNFSDLASEGRVRVFTSPMKRAIITSQPMLRHYKLPRATLLPDMCERGGSYKNILDEATGKYVNQAYKGMGRAELSELYGDTHDAAQVAEDGWWQTTAVGHEEPEQFAARIERCKSWILDQVAAYAAANDEQQPDYMVIVSHADHIDALLCSLLRVHASAKYVFYASNTSVSHLEFEVRPGASAEQTKANPVVRVRGTNIKPVAVSAHELSIHHQ